MTFEEALLKGTTGRHETFTPRYGWLKKGYDQCMSDPHVFNDDHAIERIGVGKNMIRSIRYWCLLFNLIEYSGSPGCMQPTAFGNKLLDNENGWDPYLEDPSSLWLLHWQIFKPPFLAISWNISFTYMALPSFTSNELAAFIYDKTQNINGFRQIARGSFEKDASCLIRMYAHDIKEKADIRCPFTDLCIIVPAAEEQDARRVRFSTDTKKTLHDLIFLHSVCDYASLWFSGQMSLSLSQISFGYNSPGMAFRLSETDCGNRLERVSRKMDEVIFTETDGIRQIQFKRNPSDLSLDCLSRYYKEVI